MSVIVEYRWNNADLQKHPSRRHIVLYKPNIEFPGIETGPPQLKTACMLVYVCVCVGGCVYICVKHLVRKYECRLHIFPSFCGVPSFTQGRQQQCHFKTHELYESHRQTYQHSTSLSATHVCFSPFYDPSYNITLIYNFVGSCKKLSFILQHSVHVTIFLSLPILSFSTFGISLSHSQEMFPL
jgi:hypothetical protein